MKCFTAIFTFVLLLLLSTVTISAQTFQQCADVDQGNSVNVGDLVFMINNQLVGQPPLPPGRGDIDFRQDFNMGDVHYLAGYIFLAYPEGGCPPFPTYTMINTTDSIFLPEANVPAGSGTIILPIVISNHEIIADLLLLTSLTASNCLADIDSVSFINWLPPIYNERIELNNLNMVWLSFASNDMPLEPGIHTVAMVHISYTSAAGGTVTLNPSVLDDRITHEVYGPLTPQNYSVMNIGKPTVLVRSAVAAPAISVAPDSLYFVTLSGSGNPAPQSFDISSDGEIVEWSATAPAWIQLTPVAGISGSSVTVQPLTESLSPGTHVGLIEVSAPLAYNSPKSVKVVLRIQAQYPAFDANCDGMFNISDIVYLLMYIFGGPAPCDPGAM